MSIRYAVYQAWNKVTEESYIGVTKQDISSRIRQHERLAARGVHESKKFGDALLHYGFDNFSWSIVEYVDDPIGAEEFYIRLYKSVENGCNTKYGERDSVTNKPLICVDTGDIFDSVTECVEYYNLCLSKVASVCRGDRGSTGGLVFRYIDAYNQPIEPNNAKPAVRRGICEHNRNDIWKHSRSFQIYWATYNDDTERVKKERLYRIW